MADDVQETLESIRSELQRRSEEQAAQVRSVVQTAMDRSRAASEQLVGAVDREIRQQIANIGLATQADIKRLERKIDELTGGASTTKASKKSTAKKSTSKKKASVKSPAKKAAKKK